MKTIFKVAFWMVFFLGILTLLTELIASINLDALLLLPNKGLPPTSETLKLAKNDDKFVPSQTKAAHKRINRISWEIVKYICLGFSALIFLNTFLRRVVQEMIGSVISAFPKYRENTRYLEVNFVSLIITLMMASIFGASIASIILPGPGGYLPATILYLFMYLIILPFIYLVVSKLLKIYGSRFIAACYLAYFVKAITEFIILEDVDLSTMVQVDISEFSPELREYLKERNLEHRVYAEKKKSESLNAALVGWGHFERIEIYGEHSNLTDKEFKAVLLHEIGHSQDWSLLKKIGILFAVKLIEMSIVLALYSKISRKYMDDILTQSGSFVLLYVIYLTLMSRWLMVFHKLTSQAAEKTADAIAKSHNYGHALAKVLYDITIKAESGLKTTWLYNSIKSYHPPIYDRIEYLNN